MKEIIDFIEQNVDGKTLFKKELVYELEHGAFLCQDRRETSADGAAHLGERKAFVLRKPRGLR